MTPLLSNKIVHNTMQSDSSLNEMKCLPEGDQKVYFQDSKLSQSFFYMQ